MGDPTICVTVCVGSSCHVRGASQVIRSFNSLIEECGLKERVELKGSFCMERCTEGINIRIADDFYSASSPQDALAIFEEKVIKALEGSA